MNAISANDLGLPAITSAWCSAWNNWIDAASKPEVRNFDDPDCLHWDGVKERLESHIRAFPINSERDAKALVRFIWVDCGAAATPDDRSPQVARWCLEKLIEWAEETAQLDAAS